MKSAQAVQFVNWTNEAFTHTWGKVAYTFEPGKIYMLEAYLAKHFAKHLADRECNNKEIRTMGPEKDEFMRKCIASDVVIEAQSPTELKMKIDNLEKEVKVFCAQCDSKGVRHKKECPLSVKIKEDKEKDFEGLKKSTPVGVGKE